MIWYALQLNQRYEAKNVACLPVKNLCLSIERSLPTIIFSDTKQWGRRINNICQVPLHLLSLLLLFYMLFG